MRVPGLSTGHLHSFDWILMVQVGIKRDLFLPLNWSENLQNTCFEDKITRRKLYNYNMPNTKILVQKYSCRKKTWPLSGWIEGTGCPLGFMSSIRSVLSFLALLFFFFFSHGISITDFTLLPSLATAFLGDPASGCGSLSGT